MITKPPATALREALQPGDPISLGEAAKLLGTDVATTSAALTHLASRYAGAVIRSRIVATTTASHRRRDFGPNLWSESFV